MAARSSRADATSSSSSSVFFWTSLFFPPVRFLRASSMSVGSRGEAIEKRCKEACRKHNCIDGSVRRFLHFDAAGGIAFPAIRGAVEDSKSLKRLGELFCDDD